MKLLVRLSLAIMAMLGSAALPLANVALAASGDNPTGYTCALVGVAPSRQGQTQWWFVQGSVSGQYVLFMGGYANGFRTNEAVVDSPSNLTDTNTTHETQVGESNQNSGDEFFGPTQSSKLWFAWRDNGGYAATTSNTKICTPVAATNTPTPVPPTSTATPIPPTDTPTPVPPTSTATPVPLYQDVTYTGSVCAEQYNGQSSYSCVGNQTYDFQGATIQITDGTTTYGSGSTGSDGSYSVVGNAIPQGTTPYIRWTNYSTFGGTQSAVYPDPSTGLHPLLSDCISAACTKSGNSFVFAAQPMTNIALFKTGPSGSLVDALVSSRFASAVYTYGPAVLGTGTELAIIASQVPQEVTFFMHNYSNVSTIVRCFDDGGGFSDVTIQPGGTLSCSHAQSSSSITEVAVVQQGDGVVVDTSTTGAQVQATATAAAQATATAAAQPTTQATATTAPQATATPQPQATATPQPQATATPQQQPTAAPTVSGGGGTSSSCTTSDCTTITNNQSAIVNEIYGVWSTVTSIGQQVAQLQSFLQADVTTLEQNLSLQVTNLEAFITSDLNAFFVATDQLIINLNNTVTIAQSAIQTDIATLSAKVTTVDNDVKALNTQIAAIPTTVYTTTLTTITTDLDTISGKVDSAISGIAAIPTTDYTTTLTTITTDLTSIATSIAAIPTTDYTSTLSGIASDISTILSKVNAIPTTVYTTTLSAIQSQLSGISTAVTAIPTTVYTTTLTTITTTLTTITNSLTSLATSVAAIPVTDYTSTLASIATNISTILTDVEALPTTVYTSTLTAIQGQLSDLTTSVAAIPTTVYTATLTTIDTDIQSTSDAVSTVSANLSSDFTTLEGQISTLTTSVAAIPTTVYTTTLTTITTDLDNLSTSISDLATQQGLLMAALNAPIDFTDVTDAIATETTALQTALQTLDTDVVTAVNAISAPVVQITGSSDTVTVNLDPGNTTCGVGDSAISIALWNGLGPLVGCLFTPTQPISDIFTVTETGGGTTDVETALKTKVGFADFYEVRDFICPTAGSDDPTLQQCNTSGGLWGNFHADSWTGYIPWYNPSTGSVSNSVITWTLTSSSPVAVIMQNIISFGVALFAIGALGSALLGFFGIGSSQNEPITEDQGSAFGEDAIDSSNHTWGE